MKLKNCQAAEINVFCPKSEENVYLVWFKENPADEAGGHCSNSMLCWITIQKISM